ncbi:hypothetical protein GJ744_011028 [Endocarpon pusillum]|uniref:Sidoreflexin n=1 Tax=Endocarpon pusillum TaxID=364733 RepID=A0A8H7AGH3_9EURO|nr:hypothetical protein GJ744_011028 [Endocarpon pusillum]
MSASLPGSRELPASQYDLSTYWGRVKQSAGIADPRNGVNPFWEVKTMTPEIWQAKKIVDSTLHPDTGQPVFLPFRMSCFVISNLIVTAGMLTPNMGTTGTLLWQITNQSLNVGINSANANKSTLLSTSQMTKSYLLAVSASCSVALGLNALVPRLKRLSPTTRTILTRLVPFAAVASAGVLNVFLMRAEEIRQGIDVYRVQKKPDHPPDSSPPPPFATGEQKTPPPFPLNPSSNPSTTQDPNLNPSKQVVVVEAQAQQQSLGKSRTAALHAVTQTAISRVLNATPIMVLPPLILVRLQQQAWLKTRPRLVLPLNLGLILTTSVVALPLALAAFPQRQRVPVRKLEMEFAHRLGSGDEEEEVEFNRGI